MRKQLLSIAAILLSVLIFLMGQGLLGTLTPVRAHILGFSDVIVGVIGSAYYAGFVLGCFVGPRLLVRVGYSRTFAVAAGLATVSPLLQSLSTSEFVWISVRGLIGFAAANLYMVIESWLNDRATNETRGRIFSAYMTVTYGAMVAGQWLYSTGRASSYSLFVQSAILYALCLIPVGLTRLPQPKPTPVPVLRPWRLFRISPVGVAGCIAVGFANGAVWSLAPVYAHDNHLTKSLLAAFMSAFTLGGALIQVPMGRLSDHLDRRIVIAGVSVAAACSGIALYLFGAQSHTMALVLVAVFGLTALPLYGLSVAHANDRLPREMFVEASATLLLINALASVIGPVIGAFAMTRFGSPALFAYTAAVHVCLAVFTIVRLTVMRAPPEETRDRFEPLTQQGSPTSLELDPRGNEPAQAA
ncbi:MAG TPA: MFS transporter [Rhizomicrobium sp.]|jgi:MFS family permease|nr:MFS transporter [Rhizomicrobium sp.]